MWEGVIKHVIDKTLSIQILLIKHVFVFWVNKNVGCLAVYGQLLKYYSLFLVGF